MFFQALLLLGSVFASALQFQLPSLPYPYDALEPYLDAKTMELHHSKHFKAYTDNLNAALQSVEGYSDLISLLTDIAKGKFKDGVAIRNNGGGFINHKYYFETLSPNPKLDQTSNFYKAVSKTFGSFEEFQSIFEAKAMSVFGSGWVFLVWIPSTAKLEIVTTPNQDIPQFAPGYANLGPQIVIALDVWEHAYYLSYQNQRKAYVAAWFKVLDYEKISSVYDGLISQKDEL
ncbi:hypothetical protein HK103_000960 [Boothiomyces macroporosus]|uniref:Superoxide dismutase n=1 Tax=Boothiomyces macroporosus TaxID=261099 RepID=A0AAD5UK91_9FUNG|nr:hypothetical protein HK103_000960 [Boothiomyces macroporosus]